MELHGAGVADISRFVDLLAGLLAFRGVGGPLGLALAAEGHRLPVADRQDIPLHVRAVDLRFHVAVAAQHLLRRMAVRVVLPHGNHHVFWHDLPQEHIAAGRNASVVPRLEDGGGQVRPGVH